MITRNEDLAWAAGFFDGEGCTSLARRKEGSRHLRCLVSQKDKRALDKFHSIVGYGKIYNRNGQPADWGWQTSSDPDSRRVIELLWPWLGEVKREQYLRNLAQSTWHDGLKNQLVCKDPSHKIVRKKSGARLCQTCFNTYARERYRRIKEGTWTGRLA